MAARRLAGEQIFFLQTPKNGAGEVLAARAHSQFCAWLCWVGLDWAADATVNEVSSRRMGKAMEKRQSSAETQREQGQLKREGEGKKEKGGLCTEVVWGSCGETRWSHVRQSCSANKQVQSPDGAESEGESSESGSRVHVSALTEQQGAHRTPFSARGFCTRRTHALVGRKKWVCTCTDRRVPLQQRGQQTTSSFCSPESLTRIHREAEPRTL